MKTKTHLHNQMPALDPMPVAVSPQFDPDLLARDAESLVELCKMGCDITIHPPTPDREPWRRKHG